MHMLVEDSFILGLIFPYQTADQHLNNGIKKTYVHHAQILKVHTHTHTKLLVHIPSVFCPGSNNFLF